MFADYLCINVVNTNTTGCPLSKKSVSDLLKVLGVLFIITREFCESVFERFNFSSVRIRKTAEKVNIL